MEDKDKASRSSKKLIIILAIAGVLVIGVAVLIIAVAVGMIILSGGGAEPMRDYDPPRPTSSRTPRERSNALKDTENGDATNAIIETLKQRPTIGGYALQNLIPQHGNKSFDNSLGEVKGVYTADGNTVTLLVAEFENRTRATIEFGKMIERERARGANITARPTVSAELINGEFENSAEKTVGFCSWPQNEAVMCYQISSKSGDVVRAFRQAMENGR